MAPSTSDQVDELFDVRNAYFTGNFQTCINEAQKLKVEKRISILQLLYNCTVCQTEFSGIVLMFGFGSTNISFLSKFDFSLL